ncbi:scavenger receptor class F member 2-like [Polymixia lowei]
METWNIKFTVYLLSILFCCIHCLGGLNPRGRNVCEPASGHFQCCKGWGQQGDECLIAICEGNFTCKENEVCVRPNECRCQHGYFGATCDMKCPSQFWGPECKGKCSCHPNGQCDDVTGACTCNPNRWGANCELPCSCQKGTCNQNTGVCTCYSGFWGKQCSKNCRCSVNSICDVASGQCHCNPGWYGRNCNAQCQCNGSPCDQLTGRCKCRERLWGVQCERMCQCVNGRCNQADGSCTCRPGFRGKFCREPCPAGFYGQHCRNRCGHCKGQQPCKVTEGRCITCERGWNGTRCDHMCTNGFFGENCQEVCPTCKEGHFCSRINGKCPHCNAGWMGDRCETMCPNGTYGDNCANECQDCFNGTCHFITGECLCDPGFHGTLCNISCPAGKYGVNCAQTCPCHENNCSPVSGACNLQPNQRVGVMAAAVLVTFLLFLLLSLLCCCYVCRQNRFNGSEKKTKQRLCRGFTRMSFKLPRVPLRRQMLPNVLVSHHDPENTFNCSFIEPPSTVEQASPSSSRGSFCSAETTEDCPVYSIPDETGKENKKKEDRLNQSASTLLAHNDDISEADSLPEDLGTAEPTSDHSKKTTESEGSCSGSESASSTSQPLVPQPSQRFNLDQDSSGGKSNIKENRIPEAVEKVKPRPPDPSTKPKVSWIHRSRESSPNQTNQSETVPEDRKSSRRKTSKQSVNPQESTGTDEAGIPTEKMPSRNIPGPLENINGTVQNVFRQISKRKAKDASKDSVPKSPSVFNRDVLQPHINSEAASLLAAQLKEKTRSLNRGEANSCEESSQSQFMTSKNKPTLPPKTVSQSITSAQHGVGNTPFLASNSSPDLDTPTKETKSPKIEDSRPSQKGHPAVKKTTIKKPVRKKCKEGHTDHKIK